MRLRELGIGGWRVFFFHLLTHVQEILSAKFALAVGGAILREAALSFLGLGDPTTISWGVMMHYAFTRGGSNDGMWYWYLCPGLCIGFCVLGFGLLGMYWEAPSGSDRDRPFAASGDW